MRTRLFAVGLSSGCIVLLAAMATMTLPAAGPVPELGDRNTLRGSQELNRKRDQAKAPRAQRP